MGVQLQVSDLNFLQFSVFMSRNDIQKLEVTFPSKVLVSSDKRPYENVTVQNVLAQQSFSYYADPEQSALEIRTSFSLFFFFFFVFFLLHGSRKL